jgi:hypothetical protein
MRSAPLRRAPTRPARDLSAVFHGGISCDTRRNCQAPREKRFCVPSRVPLGRLTESAHSFRDGPRETVSMALSSSGQDGALSRLKLGFESRQGQ